MIAIFLGVWSGVFIDALSLGMNNQRTENFLSTSIGHIQIHNPKYLKDGKISFTIPNAEKLLQRTKKIEGLHISNRTKISGMVSTANGASAGNIVGINPDDEKHVSTIYQNIKEGTYFEEEKKNGIVIGKKLADKLKVKINSKIILTFQDQDNEIIASAFRVQGLYKTANSRFDEMNVFVQQQDLARIFNTEPLIHESGIWLDNKENVDQTTEILQSIFPDLEVRSWKVIAPDLSYTDEIMMQILYIVMAIILAALAFGIINTMLMAILERRRELGMLMAVGLNKSKLFSMVVIETIFLSLISGPIGLIVAYFTVEYFKINGLDFSSAAAGLEDVGYSSIVYLDMEPSFYFGTLGLVIFTAILSSIYPAYKALQLNPIESIRGI